MSPEKGGGLRTTSRRALRRSLLLIAGAAMVGAPFATLGSAGPHVAASHSAPTDVLLSAPVGTTSTTTLVRSTTTTVRAVTTTTTTPPSTTRRGPHRSGVSSSRAAYLARRAFLIHKAHVLRRRARHAFLVHRAHVVRVRDRRAYLVHRESVLRARERAAYLAHVAAIRRHDALTNPPKPVVAAGERIGRATWYGWHPGECATSYRPLGTRIWVRDLRTGKVISCLVTDREAPNLANAVDLSESSFAQLAPLSTGVVRVEVTW